MRVLTLALCCWAAAGLNLRASLGDCPLCVAEDHCHEACQSIKHENPGSKYCLMACNGAHPDDSFGVEWFTAADKQMKADADNEAQILKIGRELREMAK
mmetsp:Transcript_69591/g.124009  ORF Transcript_69591/g.124009 Transcript_69591/m.124009 type:complete len:99 (-) Transcript_69591:13-309(-)